MVTSETDRRRSLAVQAVSRPDRAGQTLLLDQIHRDLFLADTALDALSLLQGLVAKAPLGSGFHSVLLQHPVLEEILNVIRSGPDSDARRYAVDMIGGWRYDTFMADWAQAYYDLVVPSESCRQPSSERVPTESRSDSGDAFEKWFLKFRLDLLDAVEYISAGNADLISGVQDRIAACLDEIDQERLVEILLLINDLAQTAIDEGRSALVDRLVADARSRATSLYFNSGQIWSDYSTEKSKTESDSFRAEVPDLVTDQADISAMFASIALRDQTTTTALNSGLAGSKDGDIIARFDPVFGSDYK